MTQKVDEMIKKKTQHSAIQLLLSFRTTVRNLNPISKDT